MPDLVLPGEPEGTVLIRIAAADGVSDACLFDNSIAGEVIDTPSARRCSRLPTTTSSRHALLPGQTRRGPAARFANASARTRRSRRLIPPRCRPSRSLKNVLASPKRPSPRPNRSTTGSAAFSANSRAFVSRLTSSPDENHNAPSWSNCTIVAAAGESVRLTRIGLGPLPVSETHNAPSGLSARSPCRGPNDVGDRLSSFVNLRVPERRT